MASAEAGSSSGDAGRVSAKDECPPIPPVKYEYLDHTADVQIHAWGQDLKECYEQTAQGMFGYMTEIDKVDVDYTYDVEAEGDDLLGLMFHFLDEWLFAFSAEPFFIPRVIRILEFDRVTSPLRIKARGWGESFDIAKHPQGTEVKAITYSNMQVHETDKPETFVIIDI